MEILCRDICSLGLHLEHVISISVLLAGSWLSYWPQCRRAGNYSLVACLRGKSNKFSKHINYLCQGLPLGHQIYFFIILPTYSIYPPKGRQVRSYHSLIVSRPKSRVSRQYLVLPIRFGCGFIWPIIWEPELPSPKYLKSKQTQYFIYLLFGDFTHFPHCLTCMISKILVSLGQSVCLVVVSLWLCALSLCLNSAIPGRCPGEHDGATSARFQRTGEVPRRQRRIHATCSTWRIHTPAGADQPLCPLSNAHEAHFKQKALDAHFSCG